MNEQAIRFRLGIFVLGSLLLLGVLIILFGGFPTYFKPASTYYIIFDNAPGVSAGTPVRRSGVKIGEVRSFSLNDETGKVTVEIAVDPGFSLRLKDQATLVQGILGGDSTIDFVPRRPAEGEKLPEGLVEPGSTLEGVAQADTSTLVQKASEVMPPAKDTMEEARKVFKTYDKLGAVMEETLKEYQEIAKATRKTIPDLRKTNDELQVVARTWNKVGERLDVLLLNNEDKITKALARLEDTLKRVNDVFSEENQKNLSITLKNVRSTSDKFDGLTKSTEEMLKESRATLQRVNDSIKRSDDVLNNMEKATKPMAERSDKIVKSLEESSDKLNKILGDVREILQVSARSDGTLQRLLSDPGLYNNLSDTVCLANRLMPRLDRILRDMEIFADKLARHPELLGVGGAIRPGSGLKDGLTVPAWKGH